MRIWRARLSGEAGGWDVIGGMRVSLGDLVDVIAIVDWVVLRRWKGKGYGFKALEDRDATLVIRS